MASFDDSLGSSTHQQSEGDKKRYRKELRKQHNATKKQHPPKDYANFGAIPLSNALLSEALMKEIQAAWDNARQHGHTSPGDGLKPAAEDDVPAFKVGTMEMYRRFPSAYDAFMRKHDCQALSNYLRSTVLETIIASSVVSNRSGATGAGDATTSVSPSCIRVADFGCGTGRIECMLADHPRISHLYVYDGEAEMLKRCLVNTVQVAAAGKHVRGVWLHPAACDDFMTTSVVGKNNNANAMSVMLAASLASAKTTPDVDKQEEEEEKQQRMLNVVARPCAFQSIQAGFLSATQHPRCQLVVCAWSLSYLMRLQWGNTRWHAAVDATVTALIELLDNGSSDAAVVVVETLGHGCQTPTRRSTLAERLESHFGFKRMCVRTDYHFQNTEEAAHMTRFFFGNAVAQDLEAKGATTLTECTGIWTLWKAKAA